MSNIVVLGSGMGGLGAAHRLHAEGIRPVIYEKSAHYGGNTASFRNEKGFLFDLGPHISFTKDQRVQDLLAENVHGEYESIQIYLNNYWRGHWLTHPVQLHMHGLPENLIVEIVDDFVAEQHAEPRPINNYEDWLVASYGRKFAELFPMQYTRKYHLTSADNMSTDWLGPRMYRPSLKEMLSGALSSAPPAVEHYVSNFRYPSRGGFLSYLHRFARLGEVTLNHEVVSIDPKERSLRFANGFVTNYDGLVSSVPLPDLLPMIVRAPADVLAASQRLACSTCVLVNLGIDRADLSPAHMTYFYDPDICFTRLSFPHMLAASNVPAGTGSIQAEVYFSRKYRPLEGKPSDWIEPVISGLRRCGLLRESDRILSKGVELVPYANVIFDLERAAALKTVHGYLDDIGIAYCGRYGDWGYMWTDESFISGERAADTALAGLRREGVQT
jgi:protoporphyrinogen oxidase